MIPVAVSSTSSSTGSLKDVSFDPGEHEPSNLNINKTMKKVHSSGTLSGTGVESTASSYGLSTHSVEKDGKYFLIIMSICQIIYRQLVFYSLWNTRLFVI